MVIQCRACLNTKDTAFIRMESNIAEGIDFFACFCLCTQLNADVNDGLPGLLCTNCSQELQVAFNFVQNARQADRILKERLPAKNMHVDVVEAVETEDDTIIEEGGGEECVVEELLEDETDIDVIINEGDADSSIVEIMEMEKKDEETFEDSLDEIELLEEKFVNTPDDDAVHETNEGQEEYTNSGEYYAEDESDNEYLREYPNREIENSNLNAAKGPKWKCIECKRVLCGNVSYEGHMNMHRSLRPYKCVICMCAFRCKIALERHSQLRHQRADKVEEKPSTSNCGKCPKVFSTPKELLEHDELVHSDSNVLQCLHCPQLQPFTRTKIIEHFHTEHPEEHRRHFPTVGRPLVEPVKQTPWQCDICKRYMRSEAALLDHRHIHQNERPHECQFCKKRFATTSNLRQHMRGVHTEEYEKLINGAGDTIVQCETCKKQLLQRNLDKHMALHIKKAREANDTQTKFLCAYCSRECKNQKSLNQHEKAHQGESPDIIYICADCDRSYATQHLLQQHRKQAHKERDHFCPICGNAFKLKNQLSNHMKLHLEKNIQCPHCEKCYARRFDLDVHMRTHTGELPFACHLCDKRFAIKVRLTYHLQKHYGIKHRCKECGAEFNSKQKLKAHSYKHTGMPYRCDKCDGHGFANRDVFKRHLQRVHCSSMSDEELVAMFQQNTGKTTRIRRVNYNEENADVKTIRVAGESGDDGLIDADDIALESEVVHTREFSNAKSLSLHEHNVHLVKLDEPKYECGICKRKCYKQRDLSSHMQRVHLAERKHVCNVCGNAFKSAWQLTAHNLLHVEDKSFECNYCQRKYTRQADLNVHIRTHTGELPYACHLCDKRFPIKVRLTYHLQRHKGIKHPCSYCGIVYDNRNQLKEHLFKHTGMPYRCELCPDVGFTRRLRFASHMQRVHDQNLSAEELAAVFAKYTGKAIHFNTTAKASESDDSQMLTDFIANVDLNKKSIIIEEEN